MSYSNQFRPNRHRLLLSHLLCFQENNIWMEGVCQSNEEVMTQDVWVLLTHSGYSAVLKDFRIFSHLSRITPRTWKCPQRKQKTHLLWDCLPLFSRRRSVPPPGEAAPSHGAHFPPRLVPGTTACWWFRLVFLLPVSELSCFQFPAVKSIFHYGVTPSADLENNGVLLGPRCGFPQICQELETAKSGNCFAFPWTVSMLPTYPVFTALFSVAFTLWSPLTTFLSILSSTLSWT